MIEGTNRMLRGGSWNNHAGNARSANRNRNEPANRNDNIGFRLALARTIVDAPFDQIVILSAFCGRQKQHALRCASRHSFESPPKRRLMRVPKLRLGYPIDWIFSVRANFIGYFKS